MITRRLLGTCVVLVALAACGSSGDADSTESAKVAEQPASTESAASDDPAASDPAGTDPATIEPAGTDPAMSSGDTGDQPSGFTTVRATITPTDGEPCEVCLWLADSADERGRGLMGVTDLGDAVGMAFVFEQPTNGAFYMFQTPTPLSIAWFGPASADGGAFVGSADMDPCTDRPANECPLYSPGSAYDLAIEVFAGGLDELGLTDGSRVLLIEGTEALDCDTPGS